MCAISSCQSEILQELNLAKLNDLMVRPQDPPLYGDASSHHTQPAGRQRILDIYADCGVSLTRLIPLVTSFLTVHRAQRLCCAHPSCPSWKSFEELKLLQGHTCRGASALERIFAGACVILIAILHHAFQNPAYIFQHVWDTIWYKSYHGDDCCSVLTYCLG